MYGFNSDRSKVEVPKIYTSSTAPQEGSAGDLWLKTERVSGPEAYAVFDSNDESLTIFRDEVDKYTDGEVIDTKTYYAGIENITGETEPKWYNNRDSVTKVIIEDTFRPDTAHCMFMDMIHLTEIEGIENFDTSQCTSMSCMFYNCYNIERLDVSRFDTSNVIYMDSMFGSCSNLTSIDVSHFNTSNVEYIGEMFGNCGNLTELDLSHFDTSKVTDMTEMFRDCYKLTATLNVMNMPSDYSDMCYDAAYNSGQLTLKYASPVTSADIDTLVATKNNGNVVNGGPA